MRKRGLKRIPQDVLPWARVNKIEDNTINIYTKKVSHWFSGNRRFMQTKLFINLQQLAVPTVILTNITKDQRLGEANERYVFQGDSHIFAMHKHFGFSKPKNFCLYLGINRTYNRKLFISRQAMRKLMKTGLISGLQK